MKKISIVLVSVLFFMYFMEASAQTTIWSEDFPYSDGITQGSGTPPKWTRTIPSGGDWFEVQNNMMEGRDLDGEAVWYSETINISGYTDVKISIDISESGGQDSDDYLRLYYSLDGGAETLFETNGDNNDDFTSLVASQTGLNGSTIAITIRVNNDSNGERHRIDNVLVVEPIAGDDCSTALIINEVTDLPFSTIGASQSGADPGCGGSDPFDIWYSYTPSLDGFATIDLCGSTYDTRLAVWNTCGGAVLLCNDDDDYCGDNSLQSFLSGNVSAGTTYYIQIGGYDSDVGDGDITITLTPFPPNNECANAIAINEVTNLAFSTTDATASGEDPNCGGGEDPLDIWFAYTATESGIASFDLCGSNYDTRLAIWETCGANLLECNDDSDLCGTGSIQSSISMEVTSGTTYYVQVGGYNSTVGDGDLTILVIPIGTNDDCTNATPINEVTDLPFTTIGASAGGDNPGCGGGDPIDIWYAYTATLSGTASFDLCGSSYDTRIAIWDACGGSVIECNDDDGPVCTGLQSSIELNVSLGSTYYIQVGGYETATGNGDLTIYVAQDVQNNLVFDGYDDYVSIANSADINTGGPYTDKTIEVWFYSGFIFPPMKQVIYEQGGATRGFNMYIYDDHIYVGGWNDADGINWQGTWLSTDLISANRWHHVALRLENGTNTVEPDKFKGFLDGVEFGSGDGARVHAHSGDINIGRNGSTRFHDGNDNTVGEYYNEKVEEIRIWNEARSLDDIRNDMHRELPYPSAEPNLVAYYKFNQSSGNTVPDNSGNGHHGTKYNSGNAAWETSTAPIPYFSILDGNWDIDNSWALGQMAPVNDWARVLIEHDIHLNQDQTLKSLVIYSGGILTIDAGYNLTMDGDIANIAGQNGLVLKADASNMSSLIHTTADVPATVEEYLTSQQWHYVSAPIKNATIETYLDIYLMEFDEPGGAWTYLTTPVTAPMNVGEGYAAWASDGYTGSTTVNYEGNLNAGDLTHTSLTYTPASSNTGYNLVGNPYPSSLEWNSNWNTTNVDATAYFWNGVQNVTWNRNTATGTAPSGVIPSTQGFVVLTNNISSSLTFPQSERIHSSQAFYKNSSTIENSVTLEVSGNEYSDKIIVGFDGSATNSFDSEFDGYDFRGIAEAPQLFTMGQGVGQGVEYAVNILNSEFENIIVPVGLEVGASGFHSIKVEDLLGINNDSFIILEDLKEDITMELGQNEEYSFNVELDDATHRFNLHLNNNPSSVEGNKSYSGLNIYSHSDMVYVKQQSNFTGEVSILNMMGQKVASKKATGENLVSIRVLTGAGYYIVTVQDSEKVTAKKVFIR